MKESEPKQTELMTGRQQRSLHLWFSLLATELNAGGYSVQLVLKEKMDLDWDAAMVKDLLWRPAQKALVRKESTTKLTKTKEIDLIFDHLNRHIGEKFSVHVPWPHFDRPSDYDRFTTS